MRRATLSARSVLQGFERGALQFLIKVCEMYLHEFFPALRPVLMMWIKSAKRLSRQGLGVAVTSRNLPWRSPMRDDVAENSLDQNPSLP
ncbi:hypothetical protein DB346_21230 [Verrucomicrobia bacterium LW23]|nr:hypothetical protein DB346_21230 [Verrucomicrobia bacterium LW23]